MEELTRTIVKHLEIEKEFLLITLKLHGNAATEVLLQKELSEMLITLPVKDEEIEQAITEAVKEVFGAEYKVFYNLINNDEGFIFFAFTNG